MVAMMRESGYDCLDSAVIPPRMPDVPAGEFEKAGLSDVLELLRPGESRNVAVPVRA